MRAKFVGALSSLQFLFLLGGGAAYLAGYPVSWAVLLIPLWILLFVGVVFWAIVGALFAKFGG